MKIGTKSLLFGAHQFLIHPIFVFIAWWKLYGFPSSPKLWIAFIVHDWGYWGKENMDGPEGETHVELGAKIMERLFGKYWYYFCIYHSRFRASQDYHPVSRLCVADKYSMVLEPKWFYIYRVLLSDEIWEYMDACKSKYKDDVSPSNSVQDWYAATKTFLKFYVKMNKDSAWIIKPVTPNEEFLRSAWWRK
jgi:hypothetical protein